MKGKNSMSDRIVNIIYLTVDFILSTNPNNKLFTLFGFSNKNCDKFAEIGSKEIWEFAKEIWKKPLAESNSNY